MPGYFGSAFSPNSGGSPSAFTSPGMNPQALLALLSMGNRAPGGGPGMSAAPGMMPSATAAPAAAAAGPTTGQLPPNSSLAPGARPAQVGMAPGAAAGAVPGGASPAIQSLNQLLQNPNLLKAIMARLGGGGGAAPAAAGALAGGAGAPAGPI